MWYTIWIATLKRVDSNSIRKLVDCCSPSTPKLMIDFNYCSHRNRHIHTALTSFRTWGECVCTWPAARWWACHILSLRHPLPPPRSFDVHGWQSRRHVDRIFIVGLMAKTFMNSLSPYWAHSALPESLTIFFHYRQRNLLTGSCHTWVDFLKASCGLCLDDSLSLFTLL
jgi:hypothetical protein